MSAQTARPQLTATLGGRTLLKFAKGVVAVRDTALLHICGDDGLRASMRGVANVAAVEAELPPPILGEFVHAEGTVGFDASGCVHLCRTYGDESVTLVAEGNDTAIVYQGDRDELTNVNPEPLPDPPQFAEITSYQSAEATITGRQFQRFVDDVAETDAEVVRVSSMLAPGLSLRVALEDPSDSDVSHEFEADGLQAFAIDEHASAIYSVDYLAVFADAIVGSPPVTLRWGQDRPLTVAWPLEGMWTDEPRGAVRLHLAPRVGKEDQP